jgi:hypothetical protein
MLRDTAKAMLREGRSIEEIRKELRGTILGCGESPTCSTVEEVIREAIEPKPIYIKKNQTADTRSCDFAHVSKGQLVASSCQHIDDVSLGVDLIIQMLTDAAAHHDRDKLTAIDHFHADFITGFKETGWWNNHRKVTRHHLLQSDGVPADVNLVDVLEMIVDCVMAGMARTGTVYPLEIPPDVLQRAVQNTAELLKRSINVVE